MMNYEEYISECPEDKFNYFMKTKTITNRTPKYWVNWKNVLNKTTEEMKISLNTLNYLIGAKDIKKKTKLLFQEQINLVKFIPILIASRDEKIDVLQFSKNGKFNTYNIDFLNPKVEKIDKYISFMDQSGLLNFLQNYLTVSLIDYVYGVQTGLDSNARKNRSGTQNENILEYNLSHLIKNNRNLEYKTQVRGKYVKDNWGIIIPEELEKKAKGGRRYDGVVYNKKTNKVTIIETNFYSGGGSKLKSVCGEFSNMYTKKLSKSSNINFVWISDGKGWNTAKNQLLEAFHVIPNIFNLSMVQDGFLKAIIDR